MMYGNKYLEDVQVLLKFFLLPLVECKTVRRLH